MSINVFNSVAAKIRDFMLPAGTRVKVTNAFSPKQEGTIAGKSKLKGALSVNLSREADRAYPAAYLPSEVEILDSAPAKLARAVRNTLTHRKTL